MATKEEYVQALAEDVLGLAKGQLAADEIPADLVDIISSAVRGNPLGDISEPSADRGLLMLLQDLKRTALEEDGFFVRKATWPNAAPFAVCLTHDVDNVARPTRHILARRGRFGRSDLLLGLARLRSLYNNIALVSKEERKRGFKSSFYLLTSNYSLRDLSRLLKSMKDEGWDIGLHGDHGTHDSIARMQDDVNRFTKELGFPPYGVREHFLKFDFNTTWPLMEQVGFVYDTTVGSRDVIGFPLGLSVPFHPPDGSWRPMKLLEIPLVLMDTTLWGYLKRSEEQGMTDIELTMQKVAHLGGLFTLLWHQEAVRMKGGRLYAGVLEELRGAACYVSSALEVARWWNARSFPLLREGDEFRFEGAPPPGLRLHFHSEGRTPRVSDGAVDGTGDGFLIGVGSPDFRLKVG